ncbi:histidine phosphatase family protein [Pseudotabrizicola alkalilacus]|uniref:Histidine phosphatase family protein n=1 Tax=Pseudotabrizicola alkalilacus TaxID=2305252 RepID=A0A411Z7I1_9RHOB|nr:histidine phosphatase family protein [Pseudotabrizicola alkalilacus]RGP39090.1 histidine phosphatase family protein [Pseudotabrizicola alkalilacus]
MTRLHLVRHGPTHAKVMVGWTDLPADLSDTAAITRLSAHLPQNAALISSDLSRAVTTADALTLPSRTRLPHDASLRELHFGTWEMQTFAQAEAADPAHIRAFWETPGTIRAPGGEGWHDITARITAALDRLPGETIVVCHFGAILAALQCRLGLTAQDVFQHKIDNLSVTELHKTSTGWQALRINHIP